MKRNAGPQLLRACKELLIAVDAAKAVILSHGAGEAWADAVYAKGISPGFGHRAEQVIADAEGRTPPKTIAVDFEPDPA